MDELERQLEAVTRLWRETGPPPVQSPRPRIVLGGQAGPRAARLAGRYADEYNTLFCDPQEARRRGDRVREAVRAAGRDPAELRCSLMAGFVVGADRAELHERARRLMAWRGEDGGDPGEWVRARVRDERWLGGTPDDVVRQLEAYAEAGIERVMLQHHRFEDLEVLELIGRDVLPRVRG